MSMCKDLSMYKEGVLYYYNVYLSTGKNTCYRAFTVGRYETGLKYYLHCSMMYRWSDSSDILILP